MHLFGVRGTCPAAACPWVGRWGRAASRWGPGGGHCWTLRGLWVGELDFLLLETLRACPPPLGFPGYRTRGGAGPPLTEVYGAPSELRPPYGYRMLTGGTGIGTPCPQRGPAAQLLWNPSPGACWEPLLGEGCPELPWDFAGKQPQAPTPVQQLGVRITESWKLGWRRSSPRNLTVVPLMPSWGPEGCRKSSKAHLSGGLETHKGGLETLWNLPPRQGEDRKSTAFSHLSFLEGLMEIKHKKVFILQKENLQEGLRHQREAPECHPLSLAPEKGTRPGIWHPGALHGQGAFVDVSPSLGLRRAGPRVSLPCRPPQARSWPLSFPDSGL